MKQLLIFVAALLSSSLSWAQQGTVEYKTTMMGGNQSVSSTSKMYYANGNVRTEVNVALPGVSRPMKQTVLLLANKPNTLYMLNEATKTYSETSLADAQKTAGSQKITVNVIGKEKIRNLNTTHAEISMGQGTMDVWTTKEIPGYAGMQAMIRSNRSMGDENLYNELKKKGVDGLFVRMATSTGRGEMLMELERYDTKPVAASLFLIPKDYKKVDAPDMQRMGNLSPAERQKLMQEMQKRQKSRQ
ncbi:hypothetical protein GCM10023189_46590 [Nibrella saemangeumensis]|uniref:DUF4412 domain-containing protein n=1 Tax=Nibrella saemangeumensis TaxID=1084526 RepID=A0ABP8NED3_9BACT